MLTCRTPMHAGFSSPTGGRDFGVTSTTGRGSPSPSLPAPMGGRASPSPSIVPQAGGSHGQQAGGRASPTPSQSVALPAVGPSSKRPRVRGRRAMQAKHLQLPMLTQHMKQTLDGVHEAAMKVGGGA